jgi:hypothetical protein
MMGGAKGAKGAPKGAKGAPSAICTSPEFVKAKECLAKACSAADAAKVNQLLGAAC